MINIKFLELNVEGFQSIGEAHLNFNNLGTCFIKGVNKYDNRTKSNGSGKSSLLMSLFWCIFGKTPTGIGNDVVNKFYKNGCNVELSFKLDDVLYMIRRSQNHNKYKTNLTILKDSEDISGRNKTDSEKIIKDLFNIDEDIFSQMIYLSQGFNNRFAIYSPKVRKDLLETMYGVNENLNDFVLKLKEKESLKNIEIQSLNSKLIELQTRVQLIKTDMTKNIQDIDFLKQKIEKLENMKCGITKEFLDELKEKIDSLKCKIDKISEKHNNKKIELTNLYKDIDIEQNKISEYNNEIVRLKTNKVCPTCGTILEDNSKNEHIQNHISEIKDSINKSQQFLSKYKEKKDDLVKDIEELKNKLMLINKKFIDLDNEYKNNLQLYEQEIKKDTEIKSYNEQIENINMIYESHNKEINELETQNNKVNNTVKNNQKELEVIQHSIRLANNQFKSYLLQNIISLLNNKLLELSSSLFENEIISITGDNKLDIYVGEKTYEQCSGGEQRKVDIAIIIAQRFLAQQMNSVSSNILICDEIFDGLDDMSFTIVLDLLSDEMQDVESNFIISHRDIKEIPFDNIITVTKHENQISDVIIN